MSWNIVCLIFCTNQGNEKAYFGFLIVRRKKMRQEARRSMGRDEGGRKEEKKKEFPMTLFLRLCVRLILLSLKNISMVG